MPCLQLSADLERIAAYGDAGPVNAWLQIVGAPFTVESLNRSTTSAV